MRIAILYNDKDIYVEFDPKQFKEILKDYLNKYNDVDKAIDNIIMDLKKETLTK